MSALLRSQDPLEEAGLITFYQHVYPVFDYVERAERQRARIREAFRGSSQPYEIISCQSDKEARTLERLIQDSWQGRSSYYAYVHLKGITHPGSPAVDDWRELLEYWIIDCWRKARFELDHGADLVGVNLEANPWLHYAGNCFWIKREAVTKLKPVALLDNPEQWVGAFTGVPLELRSLHNSNVNHYQERYPPERYR